MPARSAIVFLLVAALALPAVRAAGASGEPAAGQDYVVRRLCAAPAAGQDSCLGLSLRPRGLSGAPRPSALLQSAERATHGPGGEPRPASRGAAGQRLGGSPITAAPLAGDGLEASPAPVTPADLHAAYRLPADVVRGAPAQTIAIVDAYDDPTAEADLQTFDERFGLPPCTHADGCFTKVNQRGEAGALPPVEGGWAAEIAADVETAHSICEDCRLLLVEASSASSTSLEAAEATAARLGATEISNSWGGEEPGREHPVFDQPGTVVTAAAGDAGYLNWQEAQTGGEAYFEGASYPASSPHVVAVGGTSLTVGAGGQWLGERIWNGASGASGGGCSTSFAAPSWQQAAPGWPAVGCGAMRAVADVAADGDPYTGVFAYDSTPESPGAEPGWMVIGGTSVSSPIIAATFALAGGADSVQYPAQTLYSHIGSSALHTVASGGNGRCDGVYSAGCSGSMSPLSAFDCGGSFTICNATSSGYSGPDGVGTPNGLAAFQPGAEAQAQGAGEATGGQGAGGPASGHGGQEGSQAPSAASPGRGGGPSQPASGAPAAAAAPPKPSGGTSRPRPPRVIRLRLIGRARAALSRHRPALAAIAFAFRLSRAARVRVILRRRARTHGRMRWAKARAMRPRRLRRGTTLMRLRGRMRLRPGDWSLTVRALGGGRQSLRFQVR